MNKASFAHDTKAKRITVTRIFDASVERTWAAWTQAAILDKWWGPRPWWVETKEMNFTVGGRWLYAMKGPQGECHWSKMEYKAIDALNVYTATSDFCDEDGTPDPNFRQSVWEVAFKPEGSTTSVSVELTFATEEDMQKLVGMGFEGGFSIGMNQLDEILGF